MVPRLLVAFVKAGGHLALGSDAGCCRYDHFAGAADRERRLVLTRFGFSPLEAIRIATLNGATSLGIANRTGTIELGKEADLMIVRGDHPPELKTSNWWRLCSTTALSTTRRNLCGGQRIGWLALNMPAVMRRFSAAILTRAVAPRTTSTRRVLRGTFSFVKHEALGSECPEVICSSDVQLVVGDGRRRRDALTEIVARQYLQCIARSEYDDSAGLAGGVDAAVSRYRRGDIQAERAQALPIEHDLPGVGHVARHHAAVPYKVQPAAIEQRRRHL